MYDGLLHHILIRVFDAFVSFSLVRTLTHICLSRAYTTERYLCLSISICVFTSWCIWHSMASIGIENERENVLCVCLYTNTLTFISKTTLIVTLFIYRSAVSAVRYAMDNASNRGTRIPYRRDIFFNTSDVCLPHVNALRVP